MQSRHLPLLPQGDLQRLWSARRPGARRGSVRQALQLSLTVPKGQLTEGLTLFEDVLLHPGFPKGELKRFIQDTEDELLAHAPSNLRAVFSYAWTHAWAPVGSPGDQRPDLGALGTAQTPEFILRALLEPQAEVKEGFMSWTLTLQNGEEVQGRIESSSPQEIVLLDAATRKPLRLARSEIRSQTQAGSIMPAGLVDGLSDPELRDLLRYLAGLGRRD